MPDKDLEALVRRAAKEAVGETFRLLGLDTDNVDRVNEFRDDLVFTRELRKNTDAAKRKVWMVILGVITVGICAAVAKGLGWGPK